MLLDKVTQRLRIYHSSGGGDRTTLVETKVIDGVRYTTVRVVHIDEETNESATFTFNASGRGVVHSFEFTYPAPDPFNGTVTRSYELKRLGNVTVERPDWASKALNETND